MPIIICAQCKMQVRDSWHKKPITEDWCNCPERENKVVEG